MSRAATLTVGAAAGTLVSVAMQVMLNGEAREVPTALTVATLLTHLEIDARRVAVEVNETVVKRARYDATPIESGDVIEIVNFVGGG
ncbi:MAG: sulfur carrier protein ThiS [Vicinamibacterales bacterium]